MATKRRWGHHGHPGRRLRGARAVWSIVTTVMVLMMVFIQLAWRAGRRLAFLGYHNIIEPATFAVNLLTTMAMAATSATRDLPCRPLSRGARSRRGSRNRLLHHVSRHRARHPGLGSDDRRRPFCLRFTRLPIAHESLGIHAIGMLIRWWPLSRWPGNLAIGNHFGLFDPKRKMKTSGWRKVGTAVVRWPGPILIGSTALALAACWHCRPVCDPSYQRPQLPAGRYSGKRGICGRRPALPAGPDATGTRISRPIMMSAIRPTSPSSTRWPRTSSTSRVWAGSRPSPDRRAPR